MACKKPTLVAPFPYFGGKRRVAADVWKRFGDVTNYVEPFFGSGAVLLAREEPVSTETVNDLDGLLCNFWRAVRAAPDDVAKYADWPVSESDLHPRHLRLVQERDDLTKKLQTDPGWFDARAAGWWVWGVCSWIGGGWCSGKGPWTIAGGEWTHLGNRGRGINRQLPHLGTRGHGINRKLPHLGTRGQGIADWMRALQSRLRDTRIACGSWERVLSPSVTWRHGVTAVFLDPPYEEGSVDYAVGGRVASDVRCWAIEHGNDSRLRIALCGYGEHGELAQYGWTAHRWKAHGGYSSQDGENANASRETVWFSPHCAKHDPTTLFGG